MSTQQPSIGRSVHYRLKDTEGGKERWRAAVMTNVFGVAVNLHVFRDATDTDILNDQEFHPTSRHEGTEIGEWRWPPYVPAK